MAKNQYAWERSFDRPAPVIFLMVFLCSTRTAQLVHMFHVSLHAVHAELPTLSSKILSIYNPPRVVSITSNCSYSHKVTKFNTMSKFITPMSTNHSKVPLLQFFPFEICTLSPAHIFRTIGLRGNFPNYKDCLQDQPS